MTNILEPHNYDTSVFINCPFDGAYEPIFRGIIFAVYHLDLKPRSALEISDGGQLRLDKIFRLIENCKYSIHDISRTELDPNHGLPRFNMPFELGLDLGCRRFAKRRHAEKTALILDVERYRYQKFISDIAGLDIEEHRGSIATAITVVRNWLRHSSDPVSIKAASGGTIYGRYQAFQLALPGMCNELRWEAHDLTFADYCWAVRDWIKDNPM
jgi:hypothetical protein